MKNYILLLLSFPLFVSAQCDLELLDFNPVLGTITVAFNNTENCGGAGGPDGISELQFGFQAIDEDCNAMNIGWDFPFDFFLTDISNHPGWIYSATTTESLTNWTNLYDESLDPPYYTGDTVTFPVFNSYQSDCVNGPFAGQMYCNLENVITYWVAEGYSIQAVIWQISYGPTMYAADGGWAEVGVNGDGTNWGTGLYEDLNFLDNWVVVGDCGDPVPEVIYDTVYVELPPDTIVVTETVYVELPPDTIYIDLPPDSVYIELPPDTVYQTLTLYDTTFVYDTAYVELPADTVTLLEVDTTYIELPADTVYVLEVDTLVITDTIPVAVNWYFYDTTYIYVTDTLIEYVELPADTVVLTEYDTTYIYVTDTITLTETIVQVDTVLDVEFVYLTDTLILDCDTGEPCIEVLSPECIGSDLYIPNAFSPNNDGLNDVWSIVYDPQCWKNVTFTIFNRWGAIIYWGSGDMLEWDGSVNGGSHYVADGTYVYTCTAQSTDTAEIVQESGYITVFR